MTDFTAAHFASSGQGHLTGLETDHHYDTLTATGHDNGDLWTSIYAPDSGHHIIIDQDMALHAHDTGLGHEVHVHGDTFMAPHHGQDLGLQGHGLPSDAHGHQAHLDPIPHHISAGEAPLLHAGHGREILHHRGEAEMNAHTATYAPLQAIVPHQSTWDPDHFNGIGHPFEDSTHWHQQQGDKSCALVSQMGIYESLTHQPLSEDQVCRFAEEHHWFDPTSGTNPEDAGKVLNALGIETNHGYNASLSDLADALEHGDKVLACVNANDIWTPLRDTDTGLPVEQSIAGHAIWVTGIDQAPDGSIKIIINDSGHPGGQMNAVDAEDFLNAWHNYDNYMLVAHAPTSWAA